MTEHSIPDYALTIDTGKAWLTHYNHKSKTRIETIRLSPASLLHSIKNHQIIYCASPRIEAFLPKNHQSIQDILKSQSYDLLTLFAFVLPAEFTLPSEAGMANFLHLPSINPYVIIDELLNRFMIRLDKGNKQKNKENHRLYWLLKHLQGQGWGWADCLLNQFDDNSITFFHKNPLPFLQSLSLWDQLSEWKNQFDDDSAPPSYEITKDDVSLCLESIMAEQVAHGQKRSTRQAQIDYAHNLIPAFQKPPPDKAINLVFAEAGTGIGKTLGYLSTALIWARTNQGKVIISTYTRNLQQQIKEELKRTFPNATDAKQEGDKQEDVKFIVRKGRENYLCLMNYEEELAQLNDQSDLQTSLAFALISRWITASEDGDMTSQNFPEWLGNIIDYRLLSRLNDRRGECIHSTCPHYRRCFGEKIIREAKNAPLVIMNHALAMREQMRDAPLDEATNAHRHIIFDEGHHLIDAADSAFSYAFNGRELVEMRNWLQGGGRRRSRARGFQAQIEPFLIGADKEVAMRGTIEAMIRLISDFPDLNWQKRLFPEANSSLKSIIDDGLLPHHNIMEQALIAIKHYCYQFQKSGYQNHLYDIESIIDYDLFKMADDDMDTSFIDDQHKDATISTALIHALTLLQKLAEQAQFLTSLLSARLQNDDLLDTNEKMRLEQFLRSFRYRLQDPLFIWIKMLKSLYDGVDSKQDDELFLWFGVEREAGKALDCGLYGHYLNPMKPLANMFVGSSISPQTIKGDYKKQQKTRNSTNPIDGIVITSATLTTNKQNEAQDEQIADMPLAPIRDWDYAHQIFATKEFNAYSEQFSLPSPFDYKGRTKLLIANDLSYEDGNQFSKILQDLIIMAGGGTLALFTAIERLKACHHKISPVLMDANLPLYAQHIDKMSTTTLIDLFRAEERASLFGTDATRDGIDVPGRSLKLLIYDRIPWPRPNLLHRARQDYYQRLFDDHHIGYRGYYNDQIARMKLRQAYGRLIRSKDDYGVFVLLDKRSPTRLFSDFPNGVEIERIPASDLVQTCQDFLKQFES